MKIARFTKLLLAAVVLCSLSTACKNPHKGTTPIFKQGAAQVPNSNNPAGPMDSSGGPKIPNDGPPSVSNIPPTSEGIPPSGRDNIDNYNQDREFFKQDTVYFEFDKFNVRAGELAKVQRVADYLKEHAAEKVLVEGHCDERGTPEYNRALGERRALSVRESMVSLGINADRIHTVSFGEDKPAETGHNEAAWSKNRRGEFILLRPK